MKQFERVVAAALAGVVVSSAVAQDAVQWRVEDGGNGHWYAVRDTGSQLSWSSASTLATMEGGHLATVLSLEEAAITAQVGSDPSLYPIPQVGPWIGGLLEDGEWRWETDEPWSFENWYPPNPDTPPTENRICITNFPGSEGTWNDFPESGFAIAFITTSFIIEWSADCNGDGLVDYGQIQDGTFADANGNGVPDVCDQPGGFDGILDVPGEYSTIQGAVDAAPEDGRIFVHEGTYTESIEIPAKSITIEGISSDEVILDGLDANRIMNAPDLNGHRLEIRGLTFKQARSEGPGAALFASSGVVWVTDCVFFENHSFGGDAALAIFNSRTDVVRCIFEGNGFGSPTFGQGFSTGLHCGDCSRTRIESCVFDRNLGGRSAAQVIGCEDTLVRGCVFTDNECYDAAPALTIRGEPVGHTRATVAGCFFSGNRETHSLSRGQCELHGLFGSVNVDFEGCRFEDFNQGAIFVYGSGSVASVGNTVFCGSPSYVASGGGSVSAIEDRGGNAFDCDYADCNNDGIADYLQILNGSVGDCDFNFIPDECEGTEVFAASEPRTPESVADFIEFDVSAMADAGDTVILDLSARGDLATSTEFMFVYLDDVNLGLAFATGGASCEAVSATFEIPATDWNLAGLDGTRLIRISGNAIEPDACENPFTAVDVTVPLVFEDCNENGLWDACEIADGTLIDTDGDGISDDCDGCPSDPDKTDPGSCGCGVPESDDTDGDGILDCVDPCPNWPYDCSEDGRTLFVAVGQSIQQAIDVVPDGGVVEIAAGVHPISSAINPAGRNLAMRGVVGVDGQPATILDGGGNVRLLYLVSGEGEQSDEAVADLFLVENLVITGGAADYAAGVYCRDSSPTFRNCSIIDNAASVGGAGVFFERSEAWMIDCLIADNTAEGFGGGIGIQDSDPRLTNCLIRGNVAQNDGGGGIYCYEGGSQPLITNCLVAANSCGQGGGGLAFEAGCNALMDGCRVEDNYAAFDGGGIYCYEADVAIDDCVFVANQSGSKGGGFWGWRSSPMILDSLFSLNQSQSDGGGAGFDSTGGSSIPTITNCVFEQNQVIGPAGGGGLYCTNEANATVTGCSFQSNTSTNGGGAMLAYDSNITISEATFTGNQSGAGGGGLRMYLGSLAIIRSDFEDNTAIDQGGGIRLQNLTATMDDCRFESNSAFNGGAIFTFAGSGPSILNSTVCGNEQSEGGQIVGEFNDLGGNCISAICDSDGDGTLDCDDNCPDDPNKTEPGQCGCGVEDLDTDGDGIADCLDPCPNWPYDCSEDGQTIFVAVDQSISAAIAAAPAGGIVDIAAGTFTPGSSIDPGGKAVTIQGAVDEFGMLLTIIDAEASGSVLVFQSGEGPETTVRDIVLTGGASVYGGGIECSSASSPTILGCLIIGNTASEYGGGINCYLGCNPSIEGCTIRGNTATLAGGGVSIDASSPTILGCVIEANTAPQGAGMYFYESGDAGLGDSTVCGNDADQVSGSYTDLEGNCILDECGDDLDGNGVPDACDPDCDGDGIPDGLEVDCDGNGIADDCEIADGSADDCNGNGVPDACDIADGLEEDDNLNQIPDSCEVARGDLNLDGCIDSGDLGLLIALWGFTDPPIGDLNGDGIVAAADLGLLIGNWAPCP